MSARNQLEWTEGDETRRARWMEEYGGRPPKRIEIADDTMNADQAFRLASQGTALLWRGDFHNARQLLSALARRAQARQSRKKADAADPAEAFNQHRLAQSQRARLLNALLIELDDTLHCALRRAPDFSRACAAAGVPAGEPVLLPLRAIQGMVGSYEWRARGVPVAGLPQRIHPHYGVFSPIRGEYVDLVARAPLPATDTAFDIGTGSGVLAAVLAERGIGRVIATDIDERALACARENIERLGLHDRIDLQRTHLFPEGRSGLIVCNPPWLPARPTSTIEQAIYDPDSQMLLGFIKGLTQHLTPDGEGWLIMSDLAERLGLRPPGFLEQAFQGAGLRVLERLDARPLHPKALDATDPLHEARRAEITSLWRLAQAPASKL